MYSVPNITIGSILLLGYLFMLVSIVYQPTEPEDFTNSKAVLMRLQKERNEQVAKIKELKSQLEKNDNNGLIVKTDTIIAPSSSQQTKGFENVIYQKDGVIILGMHRSGTSILGGLINKMGLKTGGPLIEAAEDNEKGFFERIDVVLQNDEFFGLQDMYYGRRTHAYDHQQALLETLEAIKHNYYRDDSSNHKLKFREGERALEFLNNPKNFPWMLKDPRLCITLRTWLPLLKFIPVILFTYRHPLDVALSLNKRAQEHYSVEYSLRLWYVYNRRAIEQSNDLCRVVTSHHLVMKSSEKALNDIFDGFRACGLNAPHRLTSNDVNSFIDMKLQHGKNTLKENPCKQNLKAILPPNTWETNDEENIKIYRESMRLYCAMEDGSAFKQDFQFDDSVKNL